MNARSVAAAHLRDAIVRSPQFPRSTKFGINGPHPPRADAREPPPPTNVGGKDPDHVIPSWN